MHLTGDGMPQQGEGCGGEQAAGGVRPGAHQGVQARDQDDPPAAGGQGVCQRAQGGVRHVQGEADQGHHPPDPELVHQPRRRGLRP